MLDEPTTNYLKKLFETKLNRSMKLYLDTCARCGLCVEACHVYASMPETKYTPVEEPKSYASSSSGISSFRAKSRLARRDDSLRRHRYGQGLRSRFFLHGMPSLRHLLSFGIDTQQVMNIAKLLLIGVEKQPQILAMLSDMSIAKGETYIETSDSYIEALGNLTPEVEELAPTPEGRKAIPINVQDADILYVGLSGKHSIVPAAAIMNAAKENWTLSYFEAVNFAAWLGDSQKQSKIAQRIVDEATRLNVKEVVIVECGTATRIMKFMSGKHPFKVLSIVELIARYMKDGRISVDPDKFQGKLTYHDPCQLARNGGVIEEPRYIIGALTKNFVELTRDARG